MLYLILAVLSSTLVATFMRLGESRIRSTMVMFLANYCVCSLVSLFYMDTLLPSGAGAAFSVLLGLAGGFLFLGSFVLLQLNIRKNGVVLSSVFMKLGVLVPIVMAIAAFHEVPTMMQVLGFLIAVGAVLVINLNPGSHQQTGSAGFLLLLLFLGGLADSLVNIYDKLGLPLWKDNFLFYVFLSAGIISFVIALIEHKRPGWADVLFGCLIGVPNYYASRFLMLALGDLPAIVAYPVYNVATIVLISLIGVLAFREKLSCRKLLGIGLILLALVLLNL